MTKWLVAGLTLVLFGVMVAAMPLWNFRSLETDFSKAKISFSGRYYNDPQGFQNITFGQLEVDYTRLFDSPNFGFNLTGKYDMTMSQLDPLSFMLKLGAGFKRYFSPMTRYFAFAGTSVKLVSSYKTAGVEANVGLGYGRFNDVTPLAKAMKINAYLLRKATISGPLDETDLETMAYEIDNLDTYKSLADLLDALQGTIEGSLLVKAGGLDAQDIHQMTEIIVDDKYRRYCGRELKLGLGYEILDPMGGPRDFLLTTAFNFAFTSTPWAQFLCQGTLSGSYNILQTHRMEIALSYDYILFETLDFSSSYSFSREVQEGIPADTHNLSLNLVWTPSQKTHLTLGIRFGHEPNWLEWSTDISIFVGLDLL